MECRSLLGCTGPVQLMYLEQHISPSVCARNRFFRILFSRTMRDVSRQQSKSLQLATVCSVSCQMQDGQSCSSLQRQPSPPAKAHTPQTGDATPVIQPDENKRKLMLFSNQNGGLLRRQPGAEVCKSEHQGCTGRHRYSLML